MTFTKAMISTGCWRISVSVVITDGMNNAGAANYVTTFTTSFNANSVGIQIPDFARGPGQFALRRGVVRAWPGSHKPIGEAHTRR